MSVCYDTFIFLAFLLNPLLNRSRWNSRTRENTWSCLFGNEKEKEKNIDIFKRISCKLMSGMDISHVEHCWTIIGWTWLNHYTKLEGRVTLSEVKKWMCSISKQWLIWIHDTYHYFQSGQWKVKISAYKFFLSQMGHNVD